MNNNGYLIPANAKRGNLIFSVFRPIDLIILGVGFAISIISLIIVNTDNVINVIVACIPLLVAVLLVIPIPNHHNVLVAIISVIQFYYNPRTYKWKGWCVYEQDNK